MRKRTNDKLNKLFLYGTGIVLAACAFLALLLNFGYVKGAFLALLSALKPVVYALIFVFCVSGIVNMYSSFFERAFSKFKKKDILAKILSVTLGYLTFLLIIAALLIIVILPLVSSYSEIIANIPGYITSAKDWVRETISSVPILSGQSDRIMDYINESLNFSYDSIRKYVPAVMEIVNKLLSEASNMLLGLIISIYIICSRRYIERVKNRLVHAFLSDDKAQKAHDATYTIYGYFTDFFSGRLLYSLVIGIVFYVVLWIMDIPMYSFISIMIGVLVFVPVIGTVLALGLSAFFVFITSYRLVFWFFAVFTVILLLGYLVLQKYIIKQNVRTTVTASLVSVLVLWGLIGTTGAVLAVPVYLSSKLLFKNALNAIEQRKKNTSEEDEDPLEDIDK